MSGIYLSEFDSNICGVLYCRVNYWLREVACLKCFYSQTIDEIILE
jgi:hypothetical protein